jgi:hypothetical protein
VLLLKFTGTPPTHATGFNSKDGREPPSPTYVKAARDEVSDWGATAVQRPFFGFGIFGSGIETPKVQIRFEPRRGPSQCRSVT